MISTRFFLGLLGAAVSLAACGASDTGNAGADNGSPAAHDNMHLPAGDVARGKALTESNSCTECHQASYAGAGFFPNITPDPASGIGTWSDARIAGAIRDGKDEDGDTLCGLMVKFPFSDQQVADVVAFLRGLPAVANPIASECPGHGG